MAVKIMVCTYYTVAVQPPHIGMQVFFSGFNFGPALNTALECTMRRLQGPKIGLSQKHLLRTNTVTQGKPTAEPWLRLRSRANKGNAPKRYDSNIDNPGL